MSEVGFWAVAGPAADRCEAEKTTIFIEETNLEKTMEKIVTLAKGRGFIFPGSEIYGGLANTWDYGNLGVELKNNVKKAWWQKFVQENPYNTGVDCAILMNTQTYVASGHIKSFSDPLMDCRECKERFRADQLIESFAKEQGIALETAGRTRKCMILSRSIKFPAPPAESITLPISASLT